MDFQSRRYLPAMFIALHGDSSNVHARRRKVLMPQRVLRLDDAAGLF